MHVPKLGIAPLPQDMISDMHERLEADINETYWRYDIMLSKWLEQEKYDYVSLFIPYFLIASNDPNDIPTKDEFEELVNEVFNIETTHPSYQLLHLVDVLYKTATNIYKSSFPPMNNTKLLNHVSDEIREYFQSSGSRF